jgi:hypothetical protein
MWRQRGLLAALGVSGVLEALGVGVQGVLGVPEGEGGLEVLGVHFAASCALCPRR